MDPRTTLQRFGPPYQARQRPRINKGSSSSVRLFYFFLFPLSTCHCLVDLYMIDYLACSTDVTVTLSFGGKSWPISTQDMNLGQVTQGSSKCLGAIFDLSMGTNIPSGSGNPNWVVGDTFLVRFSHPLPLSQSSFPLFYFRKTFTPCSAQTPLRSGLLSCLPSQEDQVRHQHRQRIIVQYLRLRLL